MEKPEENVRPDGVNQAVGTVLHDFAAHGYPITEQRRVLVGFIMSLSKVFTPDDLLSDLEAGGVKVGRATVFRTLELMARLGYLSRVPNGGHLSYATCLDEQDRHHHHLVCSSCGEVFHFDDCPVSELLSDLQSRTGYRIVAHRLELAGVCPSCQR